MKKIKKPHDWAWELMRGRCKDDEQSKEYFENLERYVKFLETKSEEADKLCNRLENDLQKIVVLLGK